MEPKPFGMDIPHLYPPGRLTRNDEKRLFEEGHSEGSINPLLPTSITTVFFSDIEKLIIANPNLLRRVENGGLLIPDNIIIGSEYEYSFRLVCQIAGASNRDEGLKAFSSLIDYCNDKQHYPQRYIAASDALRFQATGVMTGNPDFARLYQSYLAALVQEFDPPRYFRAKLRFGSHSLSVFKDREDAKALIKNDFKGIFIPGQQNIILTENITPIESSKMEQYFIEALRRYNSYNLALYGAAMRVADGSFPDLIEALRFKERFLKDASPISQFADCLYEAIDEFISEGKAEGLEYNIYHVVEAGGRSNAADMFGSQRNISDLTSYKKRLLAIATANLKRDKAIVQQIKTIEAMTRKSKKMSNLYSYLGGFHGISIESNLPLRFSLVTEMNKLNSPRYIGTSNTEILSDLFSGNSVTEDLWEKGFDEYKANRS